MSFRDWLRLFRAQTYPATLLCVLVPYLHRHPFDSMALLLSLLAIAIHYLSFGHNSVMDYWYDVSDPNKSHHPLVKGAISLSRAHVVVHTGLMATYVCLALVTSRSASPTLALLALLGYVVFGHAYNDGLDKHFVHSWLPITLAFTCLSAFGYFLSHDRVDLALALILSYAFLNIFYQIAWEGNLKDIATDPVNLLAKMTHKVEVEAVDDGQAYVVHFKRSALALSYGARLAIVALYVAWCTLVGASLPSLVTSAIMLAVATYMAVKMTKPVLRARRKDLLRYMSFCEVGTMYTLLFLVVDYSVALSLAVFGLAYFVFMNKWLWGDVAPRV